MTTFTLDTSGTVFKRVADIPGIAGPQFHQISWSDLDSPTQGCVEALFARAGLRLAPQASRAGLSRESREWTWTLTTATEAEWWDGSDYPDPAQRPEFRPARFSDLSPGALALILKDCAAYFAGGDSAFAHRRGGTFWIARQAGAAKSFPPLTVSLGEDGKVHLAEAGR